MNEKLIYGVAYYYEYLPYDRMEEDFRMMLDAGINTIRIAESTWSTWEPKDGVFDFSCLHRVLKTAQSFGLNVIIGTPTYAIPSWLDKKYPDILCETHRGKNRYGARQNFDITHPGYLFHAERIIRRLMEEVRDYPHIIGFQLDNETKHYDTCARHVQERFKNWLKDRFDTIENLNNRFGFAYWSNSIADWDDLPDVRGTINGSFGAEFSAFQRHLVTEFLLWQRTIIDEYRRPDQFVTHNFDFEWRSHSYGPQPDVDQFDASDALTIAGSDIYHPTEHDLTGAEIAFGGAITYGLKKSNYYILETEAQGNFGWLPYPRQLRLQAFAHTAAGADGVSYWHWHSIHNSFETYWKGLLSHDFSAGAVYREAQTIGHDFARLSEHLLHLKKKNRIAIMISNRSLTGTKWFPTSMLGTVPEHSYGDYFRWIADACYHINAEYDIINENERDFTSYDAVLLPTLYSAGEDLIAALKTYVRNGGHLIATFRSFFSDEYLKVYADAQPHQLTDCFGLTYDRFTKPVNVALSSEIAGFPVHTSVYDWMELPEQVTGDILCTYEHPAWGGIPAVTRNHFENGEAVYLACRFDQNALEVLLKKLFSDWGIVLPQADFPVVIRRGINQAGKEITYYMNFSEHTQKVILPQDGTELFSDTAVTKDTELILEKWDVKIIEN